MRPKQEKSWWRWPRLAMAGLLLQVVTQAAVADGDLSPHGRTRDLLERLATVVRPQRVHGEPLRDSRAVYRLYRQRNYQPAWFDGKVLGPEADELRRAIANAQQDGLRSGDYHLHAIDRLAADLGGALERAQLDLLLSDALFSFAHDLRQGRVDPRRVDTDWYIYPIDYNLPRMLARALVDHDLAETLRRMPPPQEGYARLREALARYERIVEEGGWPSISAGAPLKRGVTDTRVRVLRRRLRLTGDLEPAEDANDMHFSASLQSAVRRYQRRNGLHADGVVGPRTLSQLNVSAQARARQLRVNMERWRWLPRVYAPRYVLVNMAGFSLRVVEGSKTVMRMPVIVGKDHRQTPAFKTNITALVLNPHWYVPRTVLRKDILPVIRRDRTYLARVGMQVFKRVDGQWQRVDPTSIDWRKARAGGFPYVLRQAAGPGNALGRVKFILPNEYGVYLHDTPHRWLFQAPVRTFSSGCIRVRDPIDLAVYLLHGQGDWDRRAIDKAITTGGTQRIDLANPVPIYIVYSTAWVGEDGQVNFRSDVYGRDARIAEAMSSAAVTVSRRN